MKTFSTLTKKWLKKNSALISLFWDQVEQMDQLYLEYSSCKKVFWRKAQQITDKSNSYLWSSSENYSGLTYNLSQNRN